MVTVVNEGIVADVVIFPNAAIPDGVVVDADVAAAVVAAGFAPKLSPVPALVAPKLRLLVT